MTGVSGEARSAGRRPVSSARCAPSEDWRVRRSSERGASPGFVRSLRSRAAPGSLRSSLRSERRLAEGEGFEPPERGLVARSISSRVPSTTQPPLRREGLTAGGQYSDETPQFKRGASARSQSAEDRARPGGPPGPAQTPGNTEGRARRLAAPSAAVAARGCSASPFFEFQSLERRAAFASKGWKRGGRLVRREDFATTPAPQCAADCRIALPFAEATGRFSSSRPVGWRAPARGPRSRRLPMGCSRPPVRFSS